jgi:hypothetical protein
LLELEQHTDNCAHLNIVCFRSEFPTLPLFSGATLLVIEERENTLSQWRSSNIDRSKKATRTAYSHVNTKPFTEQSLVEILHDADIIILMVSAEHPSRQQVIQKLETSLSNANGVLTFIVTWIQKEPSIPKPSSVEGYNTCLFANSAQQAVEFAHSILEIITDPGMIGVDFADIRYVFSCENALLATGSSGIGKGEHRAITATCNAIDTMTKNGSIHAVFVNIYSGWDFTLSEFAAVSELIENHFIDDDCSLVIGLTQNPVLIHTTQIKVVIITSSYLPGTQRRYKEPPKLRENTIVHEDSLSDELLDIPLFLRQRTDD